MRHLARVDMGTRVLEQFFGPAGRRGAVRDVGEPIGSRR